MKPTRIVVGYDGSDLAHLALEWALRLVAPDGTIIVVSAVDADPTAHDMSAQQAALRRATRSLAGAGVRHTTVEAIGDVPGSIVAAARDHAADLVAVGSHGKGRLRAVVSGSVSVSVAEHAHCSALVVR